MFNFYREIHLTLLKKKYSKFKIFTLHGEMFREDKAYHHSHVYLHETNCPLKNSSFSPRKEKNCQKDPRTTILVADYQLQMSVQSEMHSPIAVCTLGDYNLRWNIKAFRSKIWAPDSHKFIASIHHCSL